jgi:hypothetical protein
MPKASKPTPAHTPHACGDENQSPKIHFSVYEKLYQSWERRGLELDRARTSAGILDLIDRLPPQEQIELHRRYVLPHVENMTRAHRAVAETNQALADALQGQFDSLRERAEEGTKLAREALAHWKGSMQEREWLEARVEQLQRDLDGLREKQSRGAVTRTVLPERNAIIKSLLGRGMKEQEIHGFLIEHHPRLMYKRKPRGERPGEYTTAEMMMKVYRSEAKKQNNRGHSE